MNGQETQQKYDVLHLKMEIPSKKTHTSIPMLTMNAIQTIDEINHCHPVPCQTFDLGLPWSPHSLKRF